MSRYRSPHKASSAAASERSAYTWAVGSMRPGGQLGHRSDGEGSLTQPSPLRSSQSLRAAVRGSARAKASGYPPSPSSPQISTSISRRSRGYCRRGSSSVLCATRHRSRNTRGSVGERSQRGGSVQHNQRDGGEHMRRKWHKLLSRQRASGLSSVSVSAAALRRAWRYSLASCEGEGGRSGRIAHLRRVEILDSPSLRSPLHNHRECSHSSVHRCQVSHAAIDLRATHLSPMH